MLTHSEYKELSKSFSERLEDISEKDFKIWLSNEDNIKKLEEIQEYETKVYYNKIIDYCKQYAGTPMYNIVLDAAYFGYFLKEEVDEES